MKKIKLKSTIEKIPKFICVDIGDLVYIADKGIKGMIIDKGKTMLHKHKYIEIVYRPTVYCDIMTVKDELTFIKIFEYDNYTIFRINNNIIIR